MFAFLQKEYQYFGNLGENIQKFFLSCMLSGFADPILYTFLTAFLYRESHNSFLPVASYYSGFYVGLPIAFFINGLLLRKIKSQRLYWVGTTIEGIIIIAITWLHIQGIFPLFLWGILFGIGSGFFWANRNFLTLRVVEADKRMYYGSLESGIGTGINILAPLMSAGIIVLLSKVFPFGLSLSYQLLSIIAFVILFVTGLVIQSMKSVSQDVSSTYVKNHSSNWSMMRLYIVSSGIFSGIITFLPTFMVFNFLGKEGTLGSVQSFFSLVSALVVLLFASKISNKHALLFLSVSIFFLTLGSLFFGIFFSAIGVIAYLLGDAIGMPFFWAPYNTISFNAIDSEQPLFGYHHFAYVFDQELFLNCGRLLGISIFLLSIFAYGTTFALRFSPFILSVLQISQLFFAQSLVKQKLLQPWNIGVESSI